MIIILKIYNGYLVMRIFLTAFALPLFLIIAIGNIIKEKLHFLVTHGLAKHKH